MDTALNLGLERPGAGNAQRNVRPLKSRKQGWETLLRRKPAHIQNILTRLKARSIILRRKSVWVVCRTFFRYPRIDERILHKPARAQKARDGVILAA